jgi:hypothetical protein
MENKYYWLDPNAKLIEVSECGHNDYASELLKNELARDKFHEMIMDNKYPYEILHDRGWVRISLKFGRVEIFGGCIDLTKMQRNTVDPKMNIKQLSVARRICKDNNYPFLNAINDKRFH